MRALGPGWRAQRSHRPGSSDGGARGRAYSESRAEEQEQRLWLGAWQRLIGKDAGERFRGRIDDLATVPAVALDVVCWFSSRRAVARYGPRKRQHKSRRAAGNVIEVNVATIFASQPPSGRQAESPAAARLSAGIERIEEMLALPLRRPHAAVFNKDLHIVGHGRFQ